MEAAMQAAWGGAPGAAGGGGGGRPPPGPSVGGGGGARSGAEARVGPEGRGGAAAGGALRGARWRADAGPGEGADAPGWRAARGHVLVVTEAGRPVFSRRGDLGRLAGFSATLAALCSYVAGGGGSGAEGVKGGGDALESFCVGGLQMVVERSGPLLLLGLGGGTVPEAAVRRQLRLVHAQMLGVLTSLVERTLARRAGFDPQGLLRGAEPVLRMACHLGECDPAAPLEAFAPLPLPLASRRALLGPRLAAGAPPELQWVLLFSETHILASARSRGAAELHPDDILTTMNFLLETESLRDCESLTPLCLPRFNPAAFAQAHVRFFGGGKGGRGGLCLALIATTPDCFHDLSELSRGVEQDVEAAVPDLLDGEGGTVGLTLDGLPSGAGGGELGCSPMWHFLYKGTASEQYVSPSWRTPLDSPEVQVDVLQDYQHMVYSMRGGGGGSEGKHRVEHRAFEGYSMLAFVATEFELYAVFDPLVEISEAVGLCNGLCAWIQGRSEELFLKTFKW